MCVAVPLLGNLYPARIPFLLAMRYYAGNWAYSVWLFKGDSYKKLDRLTKSSGWIHDQLGRLYDRSQSVGIVGKVMAFRLMHLHGRVLEKAIPKACADRFDEYEWIDGEIVAGLVLGWNFGEGHLHREQLLAGCPATVRLRIRGAAVRHGRGAAAGPFYPALPHPRRQDRPPRGGPRRRS